MEKKKKKQYQISVSILKILYHSGSKALAPMLQLKLTAFSVWSCPINLGHNAAK